MNTQVDQLIDEALSLNAADRSVLVMALLDSFDDRDEAAVTKAWASEIRSRIGDLRAGRSTPAAWDSTHDKLHGL
jgi:putative addiction module component (TIGR02574 family)